MTGSRLTCFYSSHYDPLSVSRFEFSTPLSWPSSGFESEGSCHRAGTVSQPCDWSITLVVVWLSISCQLSFISFTTRILSSPSPATHELGRQGDVSGVSFLSTMFEVYSWVVPEVSVLLYTSDSESQFTERLSSSSPEGWSKVSACNKACIRHPIPVDVSSPCDSGRSLDGSHMVLLPEVWDFISSLWHSSSDIWPLNSQEKDLKQAQISLSTAN